MIIPVGYAQVNYIFGGGALPRGAQVVIGVENASPFTAPFIATAAADAWQDNMLDIQSDACYLLSVKAKLGPNDTGAEATVDVNQNGNLAEQPLPPQTTFLVRKLTGAGGRKGRGRMNVPGCTEPQTDGGGGFNPTALAALQTACDDFLTQLDTAQIPMVLLHTDATAPTVVTELIAQALMATQRRRIRRVGGRRTTP